MKYVYWCSAILLFNSILANAQFYNTGQAPASVKWMQITTDKFQIIYPCEFYAEANRVANTLQYIYIKVQGEYKIEPRKISVILQNRSVQSNGYVAWAPRLTEWITTPPPDNDAMDWLDHLALHEYRHVVQVSNLEQGITKILKLVFGEAVTGALSGMLPLWFYEGDAVWSETAFSSAGRGRSPDFIRQLRTIESEADKRFSYDQAYLGTYRYPVPNHYQYGYQMVKSASDTYGPNFWPGIVNYVARKRFTGAPFFWAMKKAGNTSKERLYHEALDDLNQQHVPMVTDTISHAIIPVPTTKQYTSYSYVQPFKEGYFAVRSGIDDITRFVYLQNNTEQIIHTPGNYSMGRVSVQGHYACWVENMVDLRWQQQNYSCVKLLHLETGKEQLLQPKTRLFSPNIDSSGTRVACISVDLKNQYSLQLYKIPDGTLIKNIPFPEVKQLFSPVWINTQTLALIQLNSNGKTIVRYHLTHHSIDTLFYAGYTNIDNLEYANNTILFTFDLEPSRNVYKLNLADNSITRITNEKYGADYPAYNKSKNKVIYSRYTIQGYQPAFLFLDSIQPKPVTEIDKHIYLNDMDKPRGFNIQAEAIPDYEYQQKPYRRIIHGINIHSWAPFYVDPGELPFLQQAISPGAMIFSQNKLSTISIIASVFHKNNSYYIEPIVRYEGLYPVFELSARFSSEPEASSDLTGVTIPDNLQNGKVFSLRSYLPLNLTTNKYNRRVLPEIIYRYSYRYFAYNEQALLGSDYLGYRISAYNTLKRSQRDIQPRFGQYLNVGYYHSPGRPAHFTNMFTLGFREYLPGIWKHHSIMMQLLYEKKQPDKHLFINHQVTLPRGYATPNYLFRNFKAVGEYTMPLFYPDWSLGPLAYVKRFHATAHFDMADFAYRYRENNLIKTHNKWVYSTGIELGIQMHLLRFFMPFTQLIRVSWLSDIQTLDIGYGIGIEM